MTKTVLALVALLGLAISPVSIAASTSYSFNQITDNGNGVDLTSQLSMSVEDKSNGAMFTFYNNVGIDSSISNIYFDNRTTIFSSLALNAQSANVKIVTDKKSKNLPGSSTYGFTTTYSASKSGAMTNGVDHSNEWVSFLGVYSLGFSFDNLLAAIFSQAFRTGLHVISIGDVGGSDSFMNAKTLLTKVSTPESAVSAVPVPAALWLFAPALMGLMGLRRRNSNK